jgi:hypothetical protein
MELMMTTKLILLEGIPGSGKSSAGEFVQGLLERQGSAARFWREGDFDHPADFEGVAGLSEAYYRDLMARNPHLAALIQQYTDVRGADFLLSYRKLQHSHPEAMPQALVDELARHDVYDGLPMAEYCRLALDRWRDFCQAAAQSDTVTILECCLLQNPLTVLLARHDADAQAAREHIASIAAIIQPLHPLVVYLSPQDARAVLDRVRAERPAEWADFVTWYLTGQAYGQAHPVAGWEGVVQFYAMRQRLEVELLAELPLPSLVIEHAGREWERCNAEIARFVGAHLPT